MTKAIFLILGRETFLDHVATFTLYPIYEYHLLILDTLPKDPCEYLASYDNGF